MKSALPRTKALHFSSTRDACNQTKFGILRTILNPSLGLQLCGWPAAARPQRGSHPLPRTTSSCCTDGRQAPAAIQVNPSRGGCSVPSKSLRKEWCLDLLLVAITIVGQAWLEQAGSKGHGLGQVGWPMPILVVSQNWQSRPFQACLEEGKNETAR